MTTLEEQFLAAKNELDHGSAEKAEGLFQKIIEQAGSDDPVRLDACHMMGVSQKVSGKYEEAVLTLRHVLDRFEFDERRRAWVLRDFADTLRKLGWLDEAETAAIESMELYIQFDGSLSEIGASRGFIARIAWDQGDKRAALEMAEEAAEELREGDDRAVELYHPGCGL